VWHSCVLKMAQGWTPFLNKRSQGAQLSDSNAEVWVRLCTLYNHHIKHVCEITSSSPHARYSLM
jgi:hypothetical protein